jgi:beta-glucosidase
VEDTTGPFTTAVPMMRTTMVLLALASPLAALASAPEFMPAPPPPAEGCGKWEKGMNLAGHDISSAQANTAGACCDLCKKTVGAAKCTGWTWNGPPNLGCFFKNGKLKMEQGAEVQVSGYIGPGPPLPVPPAPPPPPPPPPPLCNIDPPNQCPWYNASLSFEERRDQLIAEMTPQELLGIIGGGGCGRLHVQSDGFNEALHGVAWSGRATVFPTPMSLAATWNVDLVHTIGVVVAKEALAKHWQGHSNALSFFAPNINIVRDVRWGRAQETYGEDPTLTGEMGKAYVSGMQFPNGTDGPLFVRNVAKHFAAYNLESNFATQCTPADTDAECLADANGQYRLSYDAPVSDADMMQTFLPAFEAVVVDAKIRGIMCAYNSVNKVPLCANKLMQEQLRDRMGFKGIVITDCGAIGMMTGNHHWNHSDGTPYTPVEATAAAMAAGTDLNCGGAYGATLRQAYNESKVTLAMLKQAAGRAVYGWMELGLFEDTAAAAADTRRQFPMSIVDSAPHRALAKQAAVEGVVLLKNENATLPLAGAGMATATATATAAVAPAQKKAGKMKLAVLGPNANRTLTLTANYAGCKSGAGGPILPSCTFVNPLQGITAVARASDEWEDEVAYAQGVDVDTPETSGIAAAVAAAKGADVAIVVGGLITCQEIGFQCQEAEARDRSSPVQCSSPTDHCPDVGRDVGIGLPGKQLDLLKALAAETDTPIVLVLMSGSSVAVPWAASSGRVGAIVQHFYPGVLGGEALAEVLFGKVAPSGRLPLMIPVSEAQLPKDYLNQSMMAPPGRTHRYFTEEPLYPFGFGLSYSSMRYERLSVSHESLAAGTGALDTVMTVSVDVTNQGEYVGAPTADEVVMVYARPQLRDEPTAQMSVPRQVLLGFTRVTTEPGKTVRATVTLRAEKLRLVGATGSYELLHGDYELFVGGRGAPTSASAPAAAATAGVGGEPLRATLRVA